MGREGRKGGNVEGEGREGGKWRKGGKVKGREGWREGKEKEER